MARSLIAAAIAVLILVGLFVLPIHVPYSITVPGKVWPAQTWTLIRDRDGSIGAMLHDHAEGTVQTYAANRFERGDVVQLTLHPTIRPRQDIARGDTIASIFSNETERELTQLTGRLAATLASLDLYTAGEKASVVNEAETLLAQAEERVRQQDRVLQRLRALRERDLISEQDLEIAESQRRVFEADVAAARARLDAVQTGAKPQQLALTRTEAAALRDEIATLNDRLNLLTITSPIDGTVVRSFGSDTLLTVHDTTAYVVMMPVPWKEHAYLSRDTFFDVDVQGLTTPLTGRLHQLGDAMHVINGDHVLLVVGVIEDGPRLLPGALAKCTLPAGSLTLWEYLKRITRSTFS